MRKPLLFPYKTCIHLEEIEVVEGQVDFSDEEIYDELKLSYKDRKMEVFQCTNSNSLDAFNYWKRSKKIQY